MFQIMQASDTGKPRVVVVDRETLIRQIEDLKVINAALKAQLAAQLKSVATHSADAAASNCSAALQSAFLISAAQAPK